LRLVTGGHTLLPMETQPSSRLPGSIFFFLVLVGAVQAHFYASRLPDTLASHFRGAGTPNGWQTQSAFFLTELGVVALAAVIAFGVPRILGAVPASLINVPNKEYWLAPERRETTFAFFNVSFAWFGCAFLAFLLFVNELVFRANLSTPRQLNPTAFVTALFAFLTFVAIWTLRLIIRFSKAAK
jgi:uncharacterized membrane protein